VIAALEGEHVLAAGVHAHELQRVLDRLRTADVEVDAPLQPESALDRLADRLGQLYLLAV
jgi:hypothetical protein